MCRWWVGLLLLLVPMLAGCLGGGEPAEPLAVHDQERSLGVAVSSTAQAKHYEFSLSQLDYRNEVLGFAVRPARDSLVEVSYDAQSPRTSHHQGCLVLAVEGQNMTSVELPDETQSSRQARGALVQGAEVFWTYDIDRLVGVHGAGQDVDLGGQVLPSTGGNFRDSRMHGAWMVEGGTDVVVLLGGRNDAPGGPLGHAARVNVTVHGEATMSRADPRPIRCGAGTAHWGEDSAGVQAGISTAAVMGRVALETKNGSTMVFMEPANPFPPYGRLLFPGDDPQPMEGLGVEYRKASNATGIVGFEAEVYLGWVSPHPYWLIADANWGNVRLNEPL